MSEERDIREWLLGLPPETTVAWNDDAFIGEGFRHMLSGWVDVHVPMVEDELQLNWVWTVDLNEGLPGFDEEGCDAWVASEGDAFVVCDEDDRVLLALACYHDGISTPLSRDERDYVRPELQEPLLTIDGKRVWLTPLARLERVSEALADLVRREAGRDDVDFRFEPAIGASPMLEEVQARSEEAKEALAAGDTDRFEVMRFDDPEWMADFLDTTVAEAEEVIAESSLRAGVILAEHDQLVAARRERAQKLLDYFGDQIG